MTLRPLNHIALGIELLSESTRQLKWDSRIRVCRIKDMYVTGTESTLSFIGDGGNTKQRFGISLEMDSFGKGFQGRVLNAIPSGVVNSTNEIQFDNNEKSNNFKVL